MKFILLILLLFIFINAEYDSMEKVSLQFETHEVVIIMLMTAFVFFYRQKILKKKNTELEILRDELLNLNQTLEKKVSDAVKEMQMKDAYLLHESRLSQMGEMMSMIAHQWKQPLSAISTLHITMLMAIELEEYDLNDETQREKFLRYLREKLEKIGLHTNNLSHIISDFSNFYRPDKVQKETYLGDVVAHAYRLMEDSLNDGGIDVCLELKSKKRVTLFKNEFVQVMLNIVNNSKEQIKLKKVDEAQILIRSYDRGEVAVLEISDNGGGIDPDVLKRVFEPYFSTKLEKNGSGLGLHMSKSIIEQHHKGRIYAQNIENSMGEITGAIFTIEIGGNKKDD